MGENSPFHQTHDFYVHGVSLETASLPNGWQERTTKVQDYMDANKIGWCVEAHDLPPSKLTAFRDKDRAFVRRLLIEEMIDASELINRIQLIDTEKKLKNRALNWAKELLQSFNRLLHVDLTIPKGSLN